MNKIQSIFIFTLFLSLSIGQTYTSSTDMFGNTTTRSSDGTTYRSSTDMFGNTTTTGSDGTKVKSSTDMFGNTTHKVDKPKSNWWD